jgi:hypothetical protein
MILDAVAVVFTVTLGDKIRSTVPDAVEERFMLEASIRLIWMVLDSDVGTPSKTSVAWRLTGPAKLPLNVSTVKYASTVSYKADIL